jgi:hypothetical protein
LSKHHRRKKQQLASPEPPTKIIFTFATIRMLKDALRLVETDFVRNAPPLPNLELAHETIAGLQNKLNEMLQYEEWDKETPLDYNEIHVLYAAIHMWLVRLTLERNRVDIDSCLALCKQFSRIVGRTPFPH